jgi:hypothetical protein
MNTSSFQLRRRFRSRARAGVRPRGREQGYAIMLVAFMTSLLLLAAIVAAPSVRTERKREQEEEMIWRGKQYIHGIKLYYRKNGRFPTNLDDLTKPKNGSLRYLRQAYKDPMNKEDGTWRLIYVGPSGQLIGSLKPPQTLQMGASGGVGTPAGQAGFGSMQGAGNSQSSFSNGFGSQNGSNSQGSSFGGQSAFGSSQNGANGQPGQSGQPNPGGANGTTQQDPNAPADGSGNSNQPAPIDTSSFVGGNIIGIGSKIDRKSVIVYEKATNYHLFEFIWDPSKDTMGMGGTGTGTQVGTGLPGQPGQGFGGQNQNGSSFGGSSFGGSSGSSFGGSSFGQPSQNPGGTQPSQPNNNNNQQPQPDQPLTPNNP